MTQLTKNFALSEFTNSVTAKAKGIDNTPDKAALARIQELAEGLQSLRDFYGKGIGLTSGYRCPKLNKLVGGAKTSQHMTGFAADIHPSNGDMVSFKKVVLEWCKTHDYDQIIFEKPDKNGVPRWIHFGIRHTANGQRKQKLEYKIVNGKWSYPPYKE